MRLIRTLFKLIFLSFVLVNFSCSKSSVESPEKDNGTLKVLSSFSILSDMAQEIGGEKVTVHNLVPVGTDPHNYDPKPADVKFATDADLVLYNGLNLEGGDAGWLMRLAKSVKIDDEKIIEASKGIEPIYLKDEKGMQEVNPHAFISPVSGIIMAENIGNALAAADPENSEFYRKNMEAYVGKLRQADKDYRDRIAEIPEERRVFMASELAFQYLTKEYGLREGYIWAIDTDDTGTPDQIKNAIAFIEEYQPPVLFIESNVDRRPMETVSKTTGVPIFENSIFSDELGKPGQKADTYLKYLNYNLETISKGLN